MSLELEVVWVAVKIISVAAIDHTALKATNAVGRFSTAFAVVIQAANLKAQFIDSAFVVLDLPLSLSLSLRTEGLNVLNRNIPGLYSDWAIDVMAAVFVRLCDCSNRVARQGVATMEMLYGLNLARSWRCRCHVEHDQDGEDFYQ